MPDSCQCVICFELDSGDRRTIEHINEYGWSVVMIPEDETGPGWAFTVGLRHSFDSPEIAMFGLDVELLRSCLNTLGAGIAAGHSARADQRRDDVLEERLVTLKMVDASWHSTLFGTALQFYQYPPLPFLQMFWPDGQNRFPWDEGCALGELQPSLWIPKAEHPAGSWTQLPS
ncbi:DUF4262 domain-containing protein [Nonomuraea sp. NPDC049152]|uniref:DUF4262 domain-containing protein n=1 Tax=Nonomuraea sp. NPDC049152 TaxID=3154350 RepID=UPI00340C92E2